MDTKHYKILMTILCALALISAFLMDEDPSKVFTCIWVVTALINVYMIE